MKEKTQETDQWKVKYDYIQLSSQIDVNDDRRIVLHHDLLYYLRSRRFFSSFTSCWRMRMHSQGSGTARGVP